MEPLKNNHPLKLPSAEVGRRASSPVPLLDSVPAAQMKRGEPAAPRRAPLKAPQPPMTSQEKYRRAALILGSTGMLAAIVGVIGVALNSSLIFAGPLGIGAIYLAILLNQRAELEGKRG